MNKILLLGGGSCQLSAAKKAKELGYSVVLADYTQSPPAAKYCDVHERVSSFDTIACTEIARKHKVNGVITIGTDQPVLTAALISEALGLPTLISKTTALAVTNKAEMKKRMDAHGIAGAEYCIVSENTLISDIAKIKPPYVLKPLDSQGQRGIFKLQQPCEILQYLPSTLSYSRESVALVERFYESDEVTVSAWVQQGEVHICSVTDRLLYPSDKHIGVCIGHRFSSIHKDKTAQMLDICTKLCTACNIQNGPLYVQLLIGKEGIKVNELACRIGGAFEDYSIPYLSGFDILKAVLQCAVGAKPDLLPLQGFNVDNCTRCIATQLLFCHKGIVADMTPINKIKALPFVLDADYNYAIGAEVPQVENATARFGHAVIVGEDDTEIKRNIEEFYSTLYVTDHKGNNMLHRLYPKI